MFTFDMIQSGLVVLILMVIGEKLSRRMNSLLPAILVSGVLYLLLMWTGLLPDDLVPVSGLMGLSTVCISLIILGMGSSTNFKELAANWKVVLLCAGTFFFQVSSVLLVISLLFGRNMALGSLPGGSAVALIIQERARELGYENIIVLSVLLLSVKGLVASPYLTLLLRKEAKHTADVLSDEKAKRKISDSSFEASDSLSAPIEKSRSLPTEETVTELSFSDASPSVQAGIHPNFLFDFFTRMRSQKTCPKNESFYITLLRLYVGAWISERLELITGVSRYVFCLLVGVALGELGFLHKDDLEHTGMRPFLSFMLMAMILAGFSGATPSMFLQLALPLLSVILTEVCSISLFSSLIGKFLGFSREFSICLGLQGMMGFPLNMMISQDIIHSLSQDPEEQQELDRRLTTKLVIGGFTNTTCLSVIVAGLLIGFMN